MNDKTDWNRTCFNHMYRLRRCMWIPTKKSLAISTGNRYLPVRKFVSSGANFRVPFCLAQNPQILRDRLTHSCVSRGGMIPPAWTASDAFLLAGGRFSRVLNGCNCSIVDSFRPASRPTSLKEGGFWDLVQAPSPRELSAAG